MKENVYDRFIEKVLPYCPVFIPMYLYPILFNTLFLLVELYEVPNKTLFEGLLWITFILLPLNESRLVFKWFNKNNIKGIVKILISAFTDLALVSVAVALQLFLWNCIFIGVFKMDLMVISLRDGVLNLLILFFWRSSSLF